MPEPAPDQVVAVARRYDRFARTEAPGRSALYEAWARRVADDPQTAAALAGIRPTRRQPPLVFAVARMLGCGLVDADAFAAWLRAHADTVAAQCEARGLQTNEPLRCAALLPALAGIDAPIALLEVGVSAGLCLYPDRYSYRYRTPSGTRRVDPPDGASEVVLDARWDGSSAPPAGLPHIVWRGGIDLQPRDARDAADRAWIRGLVWPGEGGRTARIDAALRVAAGGEAVLWRADAVAALAAAVARARREAAAGARLVVSLPGVLAHVPRAGRERIVAAARGADHWIGMDAPGLHEAVRGAWHPQPSAEDFPRGAFALLRDGAVLAAVDPLGARVRPCGAGLEWRPGEDAASA